MVDRKPTSPVPTDVPSSSPIPVKQSLLSVRAALILASAVLAGVITGGLAFAAGAPVWAALLTAVTTVGGAVRTLNDVISK